MKTRSTPGFSAEASLYRSGGHYQSRQLSAGNRKARREVEPALRPPDFFCHSGTLTCCLVGDGWHICYDYEDFWKGLPGHP